MDNIGHDKMVTIRIKAFLGEIIAQKIAVQISPKRVSKTFAQESQNEIDNF